MIRPTDTLTKGYAALAQDLDRQRTARLAATYKLNTRMEKLIALRQADPAAFARLDVSARVAVGYYEGSKQAAEQMEADHDDAA